MRKVGPRVGRGMSKVTGKVSGRVWARTWVSQLQELSDPVRDQDGAGQRSESLRSTGDCFFHFS